MVMMFVWLLLTVSGPIAGAAGETGCEALVTILKGFRQSYDQRCSSLCAPYEIVISGLTSDEQTPRLEETERYGSRLTFQRGKWAEQIRNVRFIGAGGDSYDNAVHRTYDLACRRTQFTTGLQGDKTGRIGYVHADDTLYSSVNYLLFCNRYGSEHIVDYLAAHLADAQIVELSDSAVKVQIRPKETPQSRINVTFCPTKDFSVEEIETYDDAGNRCLRTVKFRRSAGGLWLPESGRIATYLPQDDGWRLDREITLTVPDFNAVETGKDYPASMFRLEFEPGTRVTDFTAGGVTYRVGEVPNDVLEVLATVRSEFLGTRWTSLGAVPEAVAAGEGTATKQDPAADIAEGSRGDTSPRTEASHRRRQEHVVMVGLVLAGVLFAGLLVSRAVSARRNRHDDQTH